MNQFYIKIVALVVLAAFIMLFTIGGCDTKDPCGFCAGTGKCKHCRGTGHMDGYAGSCPICKGSGKCVHCDGNGQSMGGY